MALKGTTKIELTNVKTGEVEVIEKHNLITNAVSDLLQLDPFYFKSAITSTNYMFGHGLFIPICPNLIGGILMYENAIPDDPNNYYAQSNNPLVGYSSNDVNTTKDTRRGSLNQAESGKLDTDDGYRFVFDFETSQGNGTISCVGLTSKWGGIAGYGSMYDNNADIVKHATNTLSVGSYSNGADYIKLIDSICMIDHEKNIAYAVRISNEKLLDVAEIRIPLTGMGLVIDTKLPIVNRVSISTSVFGKYVKDGSTYAGFCHGGDGHIWGFQHSNNSANGNSSGNATINWIKINPLDCSFTEGTWEVPLKLYRMGYQYESGKKYYKFTDILVHEGYLYCFSYDGYAIYKINVNNLTDIQEFRFGDNTIMRRSGYSNSEAHNSFNVIGNVVGFRGGYIMNDTAYKGKISASNADCIQAAYDYAGVNLRVGPLMVLFGQTTNYPQSSSEAKTTVRMALISPYLATINNLPAPVQKTADKTMKITYILREE